MKKTILFLALGLFTLYSNAQTAVDVPVKKIKEAEVPPAIMKSFQKLHPNVLVTAWEQENINFEAGFTEGGLSKSVVFGPNGQFLASKVAISPSELPKDIITQNGKPISEAVKINNVNGTVTYEVTYQGDGALMDHPNTLMPK